MEHANSDSLAAQHNIMPQPDSPSMYINPYDTLGENFENQVTENKSVAANRLLHELTTANETWFGDQVLSNLNFLDITLFKGRNRLQFMEAKKAVEKMVIEEDTTVSIY